MRIYSSTTGQEAYAVHDRASGKLMYDCYFQSRPNNQKDHAESFESIEEAAVFLIQNKGSGIRMNPGSAIISENLVIERDT